MGGEFEVRLQLAPASRMSGSNGQPLSGGTGQNVSSSLVAARDHSVLGQSQNLSKNQHETPSRAADRA